MKNPKVSVVMASRNNIKYLFQAVESILSQNFSDFEFIILDDFSDEDCVDEVKRYTDNRIKLIEFKNRNGIAPLLNYGISISKGKYIAIMDNDDISLRDRLKYQFDFMESNEDIDICGTRYYRINEDDSLINLHNGKYTDDEIKTALLLGETSIHHPTAMIRKSSLMKSGMRYEREFNMAEDYRLWCKCSITMKFANLPIPLYKYRVHPRSTSVEYFKAQRLIARQILKQHLENLKIPFSPNELNCHYQYSLSLMEDLKNISLEEMYSWHKKLKEYIFLNKLFDCDVFECIANEKLEKELNKLEKYK